MSTTIHKMLGAPTGNPEAAFKDTTRLTLGTNSLSSSNRFAVRSKEAELIPVRLLPELA